MAKARKITRTRLVVSPGFAELVVWEVPEPISGSPHKYKYRLAYVVNGVCRVRYDNERGKGDHRHLDGKESPYAFRGLERLLADFWRDVNKRRQSMRTVILGVETQNDLTRRILATAHGQRKAGDDRISFESVSDLWRVLAPKRMEIVRAMTGAGPLTIREVARRVDRDFKGVHSDVTLLLGAGILERTERGGVEFPYDRVHVEFDLMAA